MFIIIIQEIKTKKNMKSRIILCLLVMMLCQAISAQTAVIINKEALIGKKWAKRMTFIPNTLEEARDGKTIKVETRDITIRSGQVMETSMVFDNDSVTCFTKINTEVVSRLRYAYYLTDAFAISFDDSKVGKPCSGNWLITNNTIIVNGREKEDGGRFKITSFTDDEIVMNMPGSGYYTTFTAEPLP